MLRDKLSADTAAGSGGEPAENRVSLLTFSAPRYWSAWLFLGWLRLAAALPFRFTIRLHKRIGRVLRSLSGRRRAIVRRNLEICFPELGAAELDDLVLRQFENVGAFIAELAWAWFAKPERLARLFHVEGLEHVENALARGKGVLLFSGHFTTFEICTPSIKPLVPLFAFIFAERTNPLLNEMQTRRRRRAAHLSVANDDVRGLLRALARNAVVWIAADQASIDRGESLPFFGVPCMTSTAPSRLARHSGATVVPTFFRRTEDDTGYLVRFNAPLPDFPSADASADTLRLVAVLEQFVRACPEQYFWTHRRFKARAGEQRDEYDGGPRPRTPSA